jgi:hypothetical protein
VGPSEKQYIAVAVAAAATLSQQLKCIEASVARTESRVADLANREVGLSQQLKRIKRRVNHTDYVVAGIAPIICFALSFAVGLLVEHELAARFGEGLVSWGGYLIAQIVVWWYMRKRVTPP